MKNLLPSRNMRRYSLMIQGLTLSFLLLFTGASLPAQNLAWSDNAVFNPFGLSFSASDGVAPDTTGFLKLADIDNDGVKEAFLMLYESPYPPIACGGLCWWATLYYENTGTDAAPNFVFEDTLYFGGRSKSFLPYQFVDIDGDRDLDIFFAPFSFNDSIYYLENTGTSTTPDFTGRVEGNPFGLVPAESDSTPGDLLDNAFPLFVDIDNDNDYDMFYNGFFFDVVPFPPTMPNLSDEAYIFYENLDPSGKGTSPQFGAPVKNPFGLKPTVQQTLILTSFSDMDCDGDWDLISNWGPFALDYFENTGTAEMPVFDTIPTAQIGYMPPDPRPDGLIYYMWGDWIDIGGDGDLDFIGTEFGVPTLYENITGNTVVCTGPVPDPARYLAWSDMAVANPFGLSFPASDGVAPDTTGYLKLADIDNDGVKEAFLVVYESPYPPIACGGLCWWATLYYENSGTDAAPNFVFEDTLYFGGRSKSLLPYQFVDIDGDCDLDIFFAPFSFNDSIYYLENTGTAEDPDFSGTAEGNPFGLVPAESDSTPGDLLDNAFPLFVDMDNDNDYDMFYNGFFFDVVPFPPTMPNLKDEAYIYYENQDPSGEGKAPQFAAHVKNPFGLKPSVQQSLVLTSFSDMDCDGDWDLLSNWGPFSLDYFENTGTSMAPFFDSIPTDQIGYMPPNPRPDGLIFYMWGDWIDVGGDGDMDFIGTEFGVPTFYENITGNTVACTGPVPVPPICPTDGIEILSEVNLTVYPNPSSSEVMIQLENDWRGRLELSLYNSLGQKLLLQSLSKTDQMTEWSLDLRTLPAGVYHLLLTHGPEGVTRTLLKY